MSAVSRRNDQSGMALITVFMVLMVASALMVGFFAVIIADQRANGIDRDQTQAYAAAHAGLEKLTSNLATLFVTDYSPSKAQIDAIVAKPPVINGFTYTAPGGVAGTGYAVTYKSDTTPGPNFGNPVPDTATGTPITAGPYAGFKGIITKYPITVTARSTGGAEVRLRRELQTVAVPVFQFGVFSETDLTFYAGDDFNFGGRVQTNGNLFLSELAGKTLTLSDRVTAFKEVVRANFSNGLSTSDYGFTGTVNVLSTPAGAVRPLAITEGSVTGMPGPGQTLLTKPPAANSWTDISTGNTFYKSLLRNGLTGAKYLSLPLVSQGATPIDLIRRPPVIPADPTQAENLTKALVFGQRYFHIGYPDSGPSLRILLSDRAAEITNLPTVTALAPMPLDGTHTVAQYGLPLKTPHRSPLPTSPGLWSAGAYQMTTNNASVYAPPAASTVSFPVAMPAYFKIPATIAVGLNPAVICRGRTATTFTDCGPFVAAVPAGAGTVVSGDVASGNSTMAGKGLPLVTTTTTAGQVAIPITATTNRVLTVASTAAFAPGVFWLSGGPTATDGGSFICSGYNAVALPNTLTGCSGLTAAVPNNAIISTGAMEAAGAVVNRGFIKIEMRNNSTPGAWEDVTKEILELGISGPSNNGTACDPTPNAVIRLQHLRDYATLGATGICNTVGTVGDASVNSNDYWPNVLYDAREGNFRPGNPDDTDHNLALNGMMNYVSLDVGNLKRWLAGTIGANGNRALSQNGYIVYFSDRRNNKCNPAVFPLSCPGAATPVETGEYGFEDNVNPLRADGLPIGTPDLLSPGTPKVLDVGEDVNAYIPIAPAVYTPVQDVYGEIPPTAFAGFVPPTVGSTPAGLMDATARPATTTQFQWVGMINRPVLFRRALKLVNGGNPNSTTSNLPAGGLTIASENPVYVQGNYNATVGTVANGVEPNETHLPAAILADSVTLLSNAWNDSLSFQWPNNAITIGGGVGRLAATTAYRFAAVAGKSLSFPYPAAGTPQMLFGTDGGVGNFLRLLEDWNQGTNYIRYRGSIVSLFISRQATGTFKFSPRIYVYGERKFVFDDDFLLPALLPPGTPMFRDVNTLTFRQLLRPNQ